MDYIPDVSLCMGVCKDPIKNNKMEKVNNEKELKDRSLLR